MTNVGDVCETNAKSGRESPNNEKVALLPEMAPPIIAWPGFPAPARASLSRTANGPVPGLPLNRYALPVSPGEVAASFGLPAPIEGNPLIIGPAFAKFAPTPAF